MDPVRMTYSNGYQNARTGVGSKVVVFIRPCGYGGRSRCHPNFNDATSILKRSKYKIMGLRERSSVPIRYDGINFNP